MAVETSGTVSAVSSHAEIDEIWLREGRLTLHGTLAVPTPPAAGDGGGAAELVARERDGDAELTEQASLDGARFSAGLDLSSLSRPEDSAEQVWDLYLRVEGAGRLRLGRHLDDIPSKKDVLVFPAHVLGEGSERRRLTPYYTERNNLSIRSKAAPARPPSQARQQPAKDSRGGARPLRPHERVVVRVASRARRAGVRFVRTTGGRGSRVRAASPGERLRITFVIMHAYGMGGTIRSVLDFAGYLAREHDVEVVSLLRRRQEPFFPFPADVRVTSLDDRTAEIGPLRRRVRSVLERVPSVLVHPEDFPAYRATSLWSDVLLAAKLRSLEPGVLITTRAALNLIAAELAPPNVVTVAQEWMNYRAHRPGLAAEIRRTYGKLDALSVLTHDDLRDYSEFLAGRARVVRIPNARAEIEGDVARLDSKLVVAAGRLTPQKGFDLLIPAFARVVERRPDWKLRIYGNGQKLNQLRRLIFEHELYNHVALMGRSQSFGTELAKASVFALSSRYEGMPGVVLEAMSKGIPTVSFDGPTGAGDIVTSGHDGLLVPNGDVEAFAAALLEVIEDDDKRRRLGAAALETARRYDLGVVGRQWAEFLGELAAGSNGRASAGPDGRADRSERAAPAASER